MATEQLVFAKADLPNIPAPQREIESPFPPTPPKELVLIKDLKGIVHAHTTWSDGATSLEDFANACLKAGHEYLVVTDHSKAAGYANGLSEQRLRDQIAAVEQLNEKYTSQGLQFRVFSGTECDILRDGQLDYSMELLSSLDCVIASVHSVLRMDREDATSRLLTAISNPYVTILGHPTGRLLLSRAGYPLDISRILDACAEHGVAIEINANPYRLDLDWKHVRAAADRGILISINPDAHSLQGLEDLQWGVAVAQKAGLRPHETLNAKSADEFAAYLAARRSAAA